jgi:ADP-dependent NAD(P)H-hydrate dehydratase
MNPPIIVDDALLRGWPLPELDGEGDKESRGRVLVLAGSREMPGAAVLAAEAALRAGAGKLVIATPQSAAGTVAGLVPEARVIALPEGSDGSPTFHGLPLLQAIARDTAALLVGPGMMGREGTMAFVHALLPLFRGSVVLLDALAMDSVRSVEQFDQPVLLTPHAGEMAHLTGRSKEALQEAPEAVAVRQAAAWNALVALKGPTTCIARPDGQLWIHRAEAPGLAMSGSGDVLAGIIAGLAARGASPEQALVWGVALHARAGEALARRVGVVGFLARELAAELPGLLHALSAQPAPSYA